MDMFKVVFSTGLTNLVMQLNMTHLLQFALRFHYFNF